MPARAREQARRAYRRFQQDPGHPALRFKSVHLTQPVYSVRIGLHYRALGVLDGDAVIWFWIGSHADCDGLLTRL